MVTTYVDLPSHAALAAWLGWPGFDTEQQAQAVQHLESATSAVRAYTRGRGFDGERMAEPLARVVLGLAARTMQNPTSDSRVEAGTFSAVPGQPDWTLGERLTLDGYRRRIA